MPTKKIIDELVSHERDISNKYSALESRRSILPDMFFKNLENSLSILQEYIMEWLPEWLPGIGCENYFRQCPEDKFKMERNERFFWECMEHMPAICSKWAEVGLKKDYSKTDAFLLRESFELFVTLDERNPSSPDGHTRHCLVRMSDVYGALNEIMVYHKEAYTAERLGIFDREWLSMTAENIKEAFEAGHSYTALHEPEEVASLVAQILLFGKLQYNV